ncbi:MAG TPA: glycosyltransferase family 1 protein [Candidatus Paceibacterota bacterium]|nr:glycosyltransferase family 1 protein [Candidatus Paceibacterota bacterium]
MTTIAVDVRALGGGRESGVQEYTRQVVTHMLALAPDIRFILFNAGRRQTPVPWNGPNVTVFRYPRSNRMLAMTMRAAGRPSLDRLVGGADAFFFPHILYGTVSRSCRKVITFHDLSFERFPEFFTLRQRIWHRAQMAPRRQAESADRLIAVSASTARDLTGMYGIPEERISVIRSGVDAGLRREPEARVRAFRRYQALPGRFVLGLCTREPRKNLAGLIAAFEALVSAPGYADMALVLVGPGGWREGEIRAALARSPVASRIRLAGQVSPAERALWYSAASLFVYPSFFEGFGFPPLEAMACGTPVIASYGSSLPEVVGDAGVLVDPHDVREMAAAMHSILSEPGLASVLSDRGAKRAAKFTWTSAAERTLSVLTAAHSPHGDAPGA